MVYGCVLSDVCGSGLELVGDDCEACATGFYRQAGVDDVCKACPAGMTTVIIGTSVDDCVCEHACLYFIIVFILCTKYAVSFPPFNIHIPVLAFLLLILTIIFMYLDCN